MSDLSAIWTKSKCLSRTQLLQYLQHSLEREEEYLVESHLNDCSLCSDALEGLMHADLNRVPADLDEMRKAFEASLAAAAEQEKPKVPAPALKPRRTYWLYAASVLLIIGMGYSVFSFIQGEQGKKKTLGQETGAKISNADKPYFAVQDSSMERVHLELRPEELDLAIEEKKASASRKSSEEKPEVLAKTIYPEVQAENEASPAPVSAKAEPLSDKDYSGGGVAESEGVSGMPEAPRATESSKALPQSKEAVSSGRPGSGLKKSATPINQSPVSNQLNYSSAPENRNTREDLQEVQTVSAKNKTERSELQDAVQLYQKGNYKRSIRKLLRLLPDSRGNEKEDILYYLGMAYLKEGDETKAETYFAQLKQSARYKNLLNEAMKEMKKK